MFIEAGGITKHTKAPEEGSGEAGLLFAPEERNVYRRAGQPNTSKPQRSEGGRRDCFSLQRSVMSIEGRLVQEQHSSGVQCGGCLNQDASPGIEGLAGLKTGGIFNARTQGRRGRRESEKGGK